MLMEFLLLLSIPLLPGYGGGEPRSLRTLSLIGTKPISCRGEDTWLEDEKLCCCEVDTCTGCAREEEGELLCKGGVNCGTGTELSQVLVKTTGSIC